jgi:hypothetical protein
MQHFPFGPPAIEKMSPAPSPSVPVRLQDHSRGRQARCGNKSDHLYGQFAGFMVYHGEYRYHHKHHQGKNYQDTFVFHQHVTSLEVFLQKCPYEMRDGVFIFCGRERSTSTKHYNKPYRLWQDFRKWPRRVSRRQSVQCLSALSFAVRCSQSMAKRLSASLLMLLKFIESCLSHFLIEKPRNV